MRYCVPFFALLVILSFDTSTGAKQSQLPLERGCRYFTHIIPINAKTL